MKYKYYVIAFLAFFLGQGPVHAANDPQPWMAAYQDRVSTASVASSAQGKKVRYTGTKTLLTSQLVQQLTGSGSLTSPGTILSARILAQFSGIGSATLPDGSNLSDIMESWGTSPIPDVSLYRITYRSKNPRGRPTKLSGLVAVPEGAGSDPEGILVYMHATTAQRDNAPGERSEETYGAITAFANPTVILAMPDYLGYGVNKANHPYALGKLNAPAGRGIILATREFMKKLKRGVGQKIYVTGYSEGGMNALWLTRYLEETNDPTLQPTRSAPMSGPYDLSGAMAQSFIGPQPLITYQENFTSKPMLLSFAGVSTAKLTRQPLTNLLQQPLAAQSKGLFPGKLADETLGVRILTTAINDLGYLDPAQGLSPQPQNLLQPGLITAIGDHDLNNPAVKLWSQNDVVDWTPNSPVLLLGILQDELVPFAASSYPLPPAWSTLKPAPAPYAAGNAQNVIAVMRQKGIGSDRVGWTAFNGAVNSFTTPVSMSHSAGFLPCSIVAQAYFFSPGTDIPQLDDPPQ